MALELVATAPLGCQELSNEAHMYDGDFEVHSVPDSAIKIEGTEKYVTWEYEYIGRKLQYPFKRCQQQLIQDKEKTPLFSLDRIVVRDAKGTHHVFYFDVSDPINKERELYQKAYEEMKAGKSIDPQIKKDLDFAEKVKDEGSRVIRLRPIKEKNGQG